LELNRWHFVLAVKSGTTGPGNWKLYIDEVDVSGSTSTDGTGNVSVTSNAMVWGARTSRGVSIAAFDGLIDDGFVVLSALTSGNDTTLYDASFGLATVSLAGTKIGSLLDVAGLPSADRSLDAGQYEMQAIQGQLYNQSPLPIILDYVDSEGYPAAFWFDGEGNAVFHDNAHDTPSSTVTFGDTTGTNPHNGSGDPPVRDDHDLWTTVVCQADGGAAQTATDATAAARYVDRTLSKTGLKNNSDADVATLTAAYLARYKAPADRVKNLTVRPVGAASTLFPYVLSIDIQDRIGYVRTRFPGSGATMTLDLRVEGVEHEIEPGDWKTTYMAVPL